MSRLIDMEWSSARKLYLNKDSPACVLCCAAFDTPLIHVRGKRIYVIAQKIQFMTRNISVGLMYRSLGLRQAEDHIPAAGIDRS